MTITTDHIKALLDIIAAVPDIGEKAAREWAIARFSFNLGRTLAPATDSQSSLTLKVDVDPQLIGVLDAVSTAADAVAASPCDQAAVDAFAEASRNFANACGRHLRDQMRGAPSDLDREAAAVDELLRELGLDPERCRTEGGAINMGRVRSMLVDAFACKAEPLCGQCGHREACEAMGCKRAARKAEPMAVDALLVDWAHAACVRFVGCSDGVRTTDTVRREDLRMLVNAARIAPQPAEPTVTVRYDLSPAQTEGAIRDKLIELGWTPPGGHVHAAPLFEGLWQILPVLVEAAEESTLLGLREADSYDPDEAKRIEAAIAIAKPFIAAHAQAASITAQPPGPMDWPLPCDVKIGRGTHLAGTPLREFVRRIEHMREFIAERADAHEESWHDRVRAKFEDWYSDHGTQSRAIERGADPSTYRLQQAQAAWVVWKAAADAMDPEFPEDLT